MQLYKICFELKNKFFDEAGNIEKQDGYSYGR